MSLPSLSKILYHLPSNPINVCQTLEEIRHLLTIILVPFIDHGYWSITWRQRNPFLLQHFERRFTLSRGGRSCIWNEGIIVGFFNSKESFGFWWNDQRILQVCALSMMTSSNGKTIRVTGPLCGEFTGHRWIPRPMASDADLWCFLSSVPWINGWVNNREAGDLSRHRTHYDVIVMLKAISIKET